MIKIKNIKKRRNDEDESGEDWLATYADTITLLLTFFVLLYSMSTIDNEKLKALSEAFILEMNGKAASAILDFDNGSEIVYDDDEDLPEEPSLEEEVSKEDEYLVELGKLYDKVEEFIIENNMQDEVTIAKTDQGVALQLKDNVLFETASAVLTQDSFTVLDKIYNLIYSLENKILIEGHTDSRPINTAEYPSNWELSTARAVNVVRYFIEKKGVTPERLSAAGYGEHKPLAPNDTHENMAINRRVSILILNMNSNN
ncbi:OmpA family protein [Clostridium sp.]|uniref:OmpA family protein n=1 Tax=Clostridium sp. TaxID=1506 RepID=UPI0025B8C58C|nr:OmpA family protein [Clostridium sp.]